MRAVAIFFGLIIGLQSTASLADDCAGSPPDAVMTLPAPLDRWAQLICTQYGHVIIAHEGWIWSRPGDYAPVWIPSQMVRTDPAPLGNESYFTKIEITKIEGNEVEIPHAVFRSIFAGEKPPTSALRLDVTSNSGKALMLYFLSDTVPWGIWCSDNKCDPSSVFMVLNMAREPGTAPQNPR
jgi:hypothetical protein